MKVITEDSQIMHLNIATQENPRLFIKGVLVKDQTHLADNPIGTPLRLM
jgi:hypothetical protein